MIGYKLSINQAVNEDCRTEYYMKVDGLTAEEWSKAQVFKTDNEFDLITDYVNFVKDCNNSPNFEECIISKMLENARNVDHCQSGRKQAEEIVDCNSFDFVRVGDGQIACVTELRVWRTYGGITEKIGPFCFSVTLPYITYDNNTISKGQAQECAAWALNGAAGLVDAWQSIGNQRIMNFLYKKMILSSFVTYLSQSSCTNGYKTASECNSQNCISYKNAIYMPGCGWTMSESDYGCR
ncbi:MAG: hypothetical protein K1X49_08540 [Saprospiraceae bacterium]|nr:hypothetical protein [Saprospiraceae bacterium]